MKTFQSSLVSTLCSIAIVLSSTLQTDGFAIQPRPTNPSSTARLNTDFRLRMSTLESSMTMLTLSSPILSTTMSPISVEAPSIVSELMDNASHIGDVTNFFDFSETPLALPVLAMMSRIFCMVSDYLPDHSILPSEFAYHSVMLAIASAGVFNTLKDIVRTRDQTLTVQDRRCFVSLFRPAGLTWMQYNQLFEAGVFEWIDLAPKSAITSNELIQSAHQDQEDLYWLQTGNVVVQSNGHTIQALSSKSSCLFGNLRSLLVASTSSIDSLSRTTVRAGSDGARVLRIDSLKLKNRMEQDGSINTAVRNMVLEGMQAHIDALTHTQ